MKFPFFASFIIFCLWLSYEIKKHNKKRDKAMDSFWEREAQANNTRKKPLDDLPLISIPFDTLPMELFADDPQIQEFHKTLYALKDEPVANLTGISNTDLKLRYGAPNLKLLSLYDQRYTTLARALQGWGAALYEKGCSRQACTVLSFAVSTGTDISATYKLLASIYAKEGRTDKIQELISFAEKLQSSLKEPILKALRAYLSPAAGQDKVSPLS